MPGRKIKVRVGPELLDAEEVSVNTSNENASSYILEDGTLINFKAVMIQVAKVPGRWDGEGNPLYVVKSQNVMSVSAPEELRRRGDSP